MGHQMYLLQSQRLDKKYNFKSIKLNFHNDFQISIVIVHLKFNK